MSLDLRFHRHFLLDYVSRNASWDCSFFLLIEAAKFRVLYCCVFVRFSNTILSQIKVVTAVIRLIAGWFSSWLLML